MKKFICSILIGSMVFSLCSCKTIDLIITGTIETEKTERVTGDPFSLEGMSADEIYDLFEKITDVKTGDNPASCAKLFPAAYDPAESSPEGGYYGFFVDKHVKDYVEGITYYTDYNRDREISDIIYTEDDAFCEIFIMLSDKETAEELYDKLYERLKCWDGTLMSERDDRDGDIWYSVVEYEELNDLDDNVGFDLMMSYKEDIGCYELSIDFPYI